MIVRKLREDELKRGAELSALAFEYALEGAELAPEAFARRLIEHPGDASDVHWDSRWAAFEDDDATMMATFCVIPWRANFDGHEVAMGGVGGVATLPQYRRRGAIRRCFEGALADMYARGMTLSYLYPFSNAFYRRFGYELACDKVRWRLKLDGLPGANAAGRWRLSEPGNDLSAHIRAIDLRRNARYNCAVFGGDTEYRWAAENPFVKRDYTYVYFGESDAPSAYACVRARPGEDLNCVRSAFSDRCGLEGLLALFRRFAADHSHAVLDMPADADPRALLPEYSLGTVERTVIQWGMARVVNVERALSLARMKGEDTLRVAVTDGQIPENNGVFEVRFAPGAENGVRKTDAAPDVALTIQDFSRLILGCGDLDPDWQPDVQLYCDVDRARQVFYRKPAYIAQYF